MKTTPLGARAIACALLATTATCGLTAAPAHAQGTAPPVHHNVDENGVDLVLGSFNFSQTLLSIGPGNHHGLQYRRTFSAEGWVDGFHGRLYNEGDYYFVSIANTSDKFVPSGGSFASATGNGATLTQQGGTFTYVSATGEKARFAAEVDSRGRVNFATARLIDVTHPDGVIVTVNHKTGHSCRFDDNGTEICTTRSRVQSVTTNTGYQLHYAYARNTLATEDEYAEWARVLSVTAFNRKAEYCDPLANSCDISPLWPKVSFGAEGASTTTATTPDQRTWRFITAPDTLAIRRPDSGVDDIRVIYNDLDRVGSLTNASGNWGYSYSDIVTSNGTERTTLVTGPLSAATTVKSRVEDQVVTSITDALNRTTTFDYDSQTRLTKAKEPEGNATLYEYDARGNVTKVTQRDKSGTSANDIVTRAEYPDTCSNQKTCNKPIRTIDERGQATVYDYDETHGGLVSTTLPAPALDKPSPQTRVDYAQLRASYKGPNGSIVQSEIIHLPRDVFACQTLASCAGTADEAVTTIAYGQAGTLNNLLPTAVTTKAGDLSVSATTSVRYDDIGNAVEVDGPIPGDSDIATARFDAMRRVTGTVSPDPDGTGRPLKHRAVRITYGPDGQQTKAESGTVDGHSDSHWATFQSLEAIETGYDDYGRPTSERETAEGSTISLVETSYDARGRVACVAERMNRATFGTNGDACVPRTPGDFGPDRIIQNEYNRASELVAVHSGVGTAAPSVEVAATYTPNGLVKTLTDGENNSTQYSYDGHDRLETTTYPESDEHSATTEVLTYGTSGNSFGLVTSVKTRDDRTIGFTHDALGRVTAKDLPQDRDYVFDAHYRYDNFGRVTSIGPESGSEQLKFGYDALGRLTSETHAQFGAKKHRYDEAGRRTRMEWKDGLAIRYTHLTTGEVETIYEENGSGWTWGAIQLATYEYDDLGRRKKLTRGNGAITEWRYEPGSLLDQLEHRMPAAPSRNVLFEFAYNPAGQIHTRTGNNASYAYTAVTDGTINETVNALNQVRESGSTAVNWDRNGNIASNGGVAYTHSAENKLASAGTVKLYHDALGRLVWSTGNPTWDYDGADLAIELSGANYSQVLRRYVHGPGTDEPLVWYEGANNADRRYYHADERGSTIAVTKQDGSLYRIYKYDEYGLPSGIADARFHFTGQKWLPQLGLYDFKSRMMDPRLARFPQPDPVGYDDGMNMYAYVGGDPVNFVDPFGLSKKDEEIVVNGLRHRVAGGVGGGGGGIGGAVGASGLQVASEEEQEEIVVTGTRRRRPGPASDPILQSSVAAEPIILAFAEHTKGKRPSTKGKHQKGQRRKAADSGGEKADARRRPPRKRPKGWRGKWPPDKWPLGTWPPVVVPDWWFDPCHPENPARAKFKCGPLEA
jgi:RHS repeat-associated protein